MDPVACSPGNHSPAHVNSANSSNNSNTRNDAGKLQNKSQNHFDEVWTFL